MAKEGCLCKRLCWFGRHICGSFYTKQNLARQIMGTLIFLILFMGNITVYFALSIRKDLTGYMTSKGVMYPPHVNRAHEVLWWTHRVAAMVWTTILFIQLWSVWIWGYIGFAKFHNWVGMGIILATVVNNLTGVIAMIMQPFENLFTTVFISINVTYNTVLVVGFLVSRWKRFPIIGKKQLHPIIAFGFMVSPFGFVMQFVLFAFIISWDDTDVEWKWNSSLMTVMSAGWVMCFCLLLLFQHTRLAVKIRGPTFPLNRPKETDDETSKAKEMTSVA